jgi:hypothetical protein
MPLKYPLIEGVRGHLEDILKSTKMVAMTMPYFISNIAKKQLRAVHSSLEQLTFTFEVQVNGAFANSCLLGHPPRPRTEAETAEQKAEKPAEQ